MKKDSAIRSKKTHLMVKIGVFSAIAFALTFFKINLPFFPSFLDLELSDVPEVVMLFSSGTIPAVFVLLVKNILMLTKTTSAGIGELANFTIGCSYLIVMGLIYGRFKNEKGLIIGAVPAILVTTVTACLFNYFILIPAYVAILNIPIEGILGAANAVNSSVTDLKTLVLFAIAPFNVLKSVTYSVCSFLLYKSLKQHLKFL